MGKTISLFMWGFQEHFRIQLQQFAKDIFYQIGVEHEPEVFLVGIRKKDSKAAHPVCIEPEYQKWNLSIFEGINEKIEEAYENDPNHHLVYTNDDISMQEKPEGIRRGCIVTAISNALEIYDKQNGAQSFCSAAYPIGDYYVVPVIQIDSILVSQLASVNVELYDYYSREMYSYQLSFLRSCIVNILEQAVLELAKPHPGRDIKNSFSKSEYVVPLAAKSFLNLLYLSVHAKAIAKGPMYYTAGNCLFNDFNKISSFSYEGEPIEGKIIVFNPEDDVVSFHLRFEKQVFIRDYRWVRKLLNMTTTDVSLISDGAKVYGLGCLKQSDDKDGGDTLIVEFLGHYDWCLYYRNQAMIRSTYENPVFPKSIFDQQLFVENFSRVFPQSTQHNQKYIWELVSHAFQELSGCMLIIVTDAEKESRRLASQSTPIVPTMLTQDLLTRVRRIDGGILLDYTGVCYSIGVILDGDINFKCTPSRGSRYNSAMRYVYGPKKRKVEKMAIVISDDKTVEVEPLLKPKISEGELEGYILKLEMATSDDYMEYQLWLDKHRFYINKCRCRRINLALERIRNLPYEDMAIRYIVPEFISNDEMEDEYLV